MTEVLAAMRAMKTHGVEHGSFRFDRTKQHNKRLAYRITPKTWRKPKAAEPATDVAASPPPEVGGKASGPFAYSAAAANDAAPVKAKPRLVVVPTRSFQPDGERWELVNSRAHKGAMRGFSRKQRGSRMHKLGMAA